MSMETTESVSKSKKELEIRKELRREKKKKEQVRQKRNSSLHPDKDKRASDFLLDAAWLDTTQLDTALLDT